MEIRMLEQPELLPALHQLNMGGLCGFNRAEEQPGRCGGISEIYSIRLYQ